MDTPVTSWRIENLAESEGNYFDGEKWTVSLPQQLHLLTSWYIDEPCDHLYITCIDPHGKTLMQELEEIQVRDDLPRFHLASYPLNQLWYTVDGCYTLTLAYFSGGWLYQQYGSIRLFLAQGE